MTSEKRRQLKEKRIIQALNTNKPCDCSDCGGKELIGPCLNEIREDYRKLIFRKNNQNRPNQNRLSQTSLHQYYVNPTFNRTISSSSIGCVNVRISII